MKLDINKVKQIPKELTSEFGVCFYGHPNDEVKQWIVEHGLEAQSVGPYVNVMVNKQLSEVFALPPKFKYMDGFSPNLNKKLHIGHASNMVIAKAFASLGICEQTVAILGDTLQGEVSKADALQKFEDYCKMFGYKVDKLFFASEMKYDGKLEDGAGKYEGTKIFVIDDQKVVGLKAGGETTYFYQDAALAQLLNSPTLYLTGHEQDVHFGNLKKMFPTVQHIGLGLVTVNGGKMGSRFGNAIELEEVLQFLMEEFNDVAVAYNVLAGFILKSAPKSSKSMDMDTIKNPLNSPGLYLSYTLAKLKSAGVVCSEVSEFSSLHLQFKKMKAQSSNMPSTLLEGLLEHAKNISGLYESHRIKDNEENKAMFGVMASDLLLGMKSIGMFDIDKV